MGCFDILSRKAVTNKVDNGNISSLFLQSRPWCAVTDAIDKQDILERRIR